MEKYIMVDMTKETITIKVLRSFRDDVGFAKYPLVYFDISKSEIEDGLYEPIA